MNKDRKGFTLIELLAVVVILGVIMMLAIPNIVSTINRNKKEAFLEDAKKFQASVEYKLVSDTKLQKPNANSALVLTLEQVEKADISVSPYGTKYSPKMSFVVITKEPVEVTIDDGSGRKDTSYSEYTYYVRLVACTNDECHKDDIDQRYGINLGRVDDKIDSDRYELVVQAEEVDENLPSDTSYIHSVIGSDKAINYYGTN